jgi:hypothetical protein
MKGFDAPVLLGLLERVNLSHWANQVGISTSIRSSEIFEREISGSFAEKKMEIRRKI